LRPIFTPIFWAVAACAIMIAERMMIIFFMFLGFLDNYFQM
jgi:hypothetical protein